MKAQSLRLRKREFIFGNKMEEFIWNGQCLSHLVGIMTITNREYIKSTVGDGAGRMIVFPSKSEVSSKKMSFSQHSTAHSTEQSDPNTHHQPHTQQWE